MRISLMFIQKFDRSVWRYFHCNVIGLTKSPIIINMERAVTKKKYDYNRNKAIALNWHHIKSKIKSEREMCTIISYHIISFK